MGGQLWSFGASTNGQPTPLGDADASTGIDRPGPLRSSVALDKVVGTDGTTWCLNRAALDKRPLPTKGQRPQKWTAPAKITEDVRRPARDPGQCSLGNHPKYADPVGCQQCYADNLASMQEGNWLPPESFEQIEKWKQDTRIDHVI